MKTNPLLMIIWRAETITEACNHPLFLAHTFCHNFWVWTVNRLCLPHCTVYLACVRRANASYKLRERSPPKKHPTWYTVAFLDFVNHNLDDTSRLLITFLNENLFRLYYWILNMVRWRFWIIFSILRFFSDFLMMKCFEIPISLWKHCFKLFFKLVGTPSSFKQTYYEEIYIFCLTKGDLMFAYLVVSSSCVGLYHKCAMLRGESEEKESWSWKM